MERNTFAVGEYIGVPARDVLDYLSDIDNLDTWASTSRIVERLDERTVLIGGTPYAGPLQVRLRATSAGEIGVLEWMVSQPKGQMAHVYLMAIFPADYPGTEPIPAPGVVGQGGDSNRASDAGADRQAAIRGSFLHWFGFVHPLRSSPTAREAMEVVKTSECRGIKALLERRAGARAAVPGRWRVESTTLWVAAPAADAAAYLSDPGTVDAWSHLVRRDGGAGNPRTVDAYGNGVSLQARAHDLGDYLVVEHDYHHDEAGLSQRCPLFLIPGTFAFGDPAAAGHLHHRIAFRPPDGAPPNGQVTLADRTTESINAKRILEERAGDVASFAQGLSYRPAGLPHPEPARVS